jgi:alkaline phosphatase D
MEKTSIGRFAMRSLNTRSGRRRFLLQSAIATGTLLSSSLRAKGGFARSPALITLDKNRPQIPYGVASGDVSGNSAVIWSRSDRPAQMIVEYSTTESFRDVRRILGSAALPNSDFTARLSLTNLPPGETIFYRVLFQDLADASLQSVPSLGQLRTAPRAANRDIFFAWSGDTAGQGWGINPEWGGMKIYEAMRRLNPDFFIHSGDTVYADNPILPEVKLADGSLWKNLTTLEKSKVAETLDEFRGNFRYNLLDDHVRRFNAEVPQLVQWDDHELRNNWYPGQTILNDDRYTVKEVPLLEARARQAFLEYSPIRPNSADPQQIYRAFRYGRSLDIFMLDKRSYRGSNSPNRQPTSSPETAFLGNRQLNWLKQQLKTSTATWKVIASDMPIGLVVADGKTNFENAANGDGPALGRELEFADLFRFIKRENIRNIVWLTADVHYAAAHYYDPEKAQFADFNGFWEFVAGPLNSGTFGPNALDNTFGPQVKFQSVSPAMKPNRPPSEGLQFFGTVRIDRQTQAMTVTLHNLTGQPLYQVNLPAIAPSMATQAVDDRFGQQA